MNVRIARRAKREMERLDKQGRAAADQPHLLATELLEYVAKQGDVAADGR